MSKPRATRVIVVDSEVPQDSWMRVDLDATLRAAQEIARNEVVIEATPVHASWNWPTHTAAAGVQAEPPTNLVSLRTREDAPRRPLRRIPEADIVLVGREAHPASEPLEEHSPWRSGSRARLVLLSLILGLALFHLAYSRDFFVKPYAIEVLPTLDPRSVVT